MRHPMPKKSHVLNDEVDVSSARTGSIRICVLLCRGVALSCLLMAAASGAQTPPIKLFDLGYTLKIDANNRDQVRMAWDHCHAVAALQGLVNRQGPVLYLRFTESQHRRGNIDDFWLRAIVRAGAVAARPAGRAH